MQRKQKRGINKESEDRDFVKGKKIDRFQVETRKYCFEISERLTVIAYELVCLSVLLQFTFTFPFSKIPFHLFLASSYRLTTNKLYLKASYLLCVFVRLCKRAPAAR